MCHPFFAELRENKIELPNGAPPPTQLFKFTEEEIAAMSPQQQQMLVRN